MVVLDGSIVTVGNNQYLQPDYFAPTSTAIDSKKSPLALLAQTCSQIGADSSAVKPLLSIDKSKKSGSTSSASSTSSSTSSLCSSENATSKSPVQAKSPKSVTPTGTTTEIKLAFKPYETNVLSAQNAHTFKSAASIAMSTQEEQHQQQQQQQQRPNSKSNSETRAPSRNKSAGSPNDQQQRKSSVGAPSPNEQQQRKTVSPAGSSQRGASPIVRSGMEVLNNVNGAAQHPKEMSSMAAAFAAYKAAGPYGLNPLSALCCPPGMEQHSANPAFRPPFAGAPFAHQALLAAAAVNGGFHPGAAPGGSAGAGQPNPYISYQRIKTPTGGEAIVPVCKDPYCPGCPFSAHSHQMMMGAPCPAGCTQCEHQKYGMAAMMGAAGLPPGHPYSQVAAAAAAANAAAARNAPYVCNWVSGDSYCGKRFQTSDEFFNHLRSAHTGNISDPALAAAALAQSQSQGPSLAMLGSIFPQSALRGGYPTPPLSPMSAAAAARYHPYAKAPPSALAAGPSPFGAAGFNPAAAAAAAAALGSYYPPYAMYGQRLGPAAVHQ